MNGRSMLILLTRRCEIFVILNKSIVQYEFCKAFTTFMVFDNIFLFKYMCEMAEFPPVIYHYSLLAVYCTANNSDNWCQTRSKYRGKFLP